MAGNKYMSHRNQKLVNAKADTEDTNKALPSALLELTAGVCHSRAGGNPEHRTLDSRLRENDDQPPK
jgi:hypothetical protein